MLTWIEKPQIPIAGPCGAKCGEFCSPVCYCLGGGYEVE